MRLFSMDEEQSELDVKKKALVVLFVYFLWRWSSG